MLMTVPDLHEAAAVLRAAGATVGDPVDGLISESKAVLAVDPDGVVVELAQSTHAGDTAAAQAAIRPLSRHIAGRAGDDGVHSMPQHLFARADHGRSTAGPGGWRLHAAA